MTNFSSNLNRTQLETLYRRSSRANYLTNWLRTQVHQTGQALVNWLTRNRNQPRISQTQLVSGEPIWTVYDPYTNHRASFTSDIEVRQWLEQRYQH